MESKEVVPMLKVKDFLHMNSGNEEYSYSNNSCLQETAIRKVQPILKETIKRIANLDGFPRCFNLADLGCSSGLNTLLAVSNIIDEVHEVCTQKNHIVPQFQVFLNDLYGNDFNSIFKSLPLFYAKKNKEKEDHSGRCFISAVPGSFHERLFPNQSIHFFHSSYSLHWLSQVPIGLENNKLNIYMAKTSPPNVFEAYRLQFQTDFTAFLKSRSEEIICGGYMVLTFPGRSKVDPCCNDSNRLWELLAKSLVDMAKEGLVEESNIQLFNLPLYFPCEDEIKDLIQNQGSFSLDIFESFEVNWNPYDTEYASVEVSNEPNHGKSVAQMVRAGLESTLVTYFGKSAMDMLFQKFETYVDQHLATEKTKNFNIIISLRKN